MPSKTKLIIFDLDGTLIHFHHDYLFSQTKSILEKLEHPGVPRTELEKHFSEFDFFSFAKTDCKKTFEEKYWSHFDWHSFPKDVVFPGVFELLEKLKSRDLKLAMATARLSSLEQLKKDIAHTKLLPYFDLVRTREAEQTHWQDKTGHLTSILKELNIEAEDALMVGDIPSDVVSAKKVGIRLTAAVTSGGIRQEILAKEKPDYIFDSIARMSEIF